MKTVLWVVLSLFVSWLLVSAMWSDAERRAKCREIGNVVKPAGYMGRDFVCVQK